MLPPGYEPQPHSPAEAGVLLVALEAVWDNSHPDSRALNTDRLVNSPKRRQVRWCWHIVDSIAFQLLTIYQSAKKTAFESTRWRHISRTELPW